MSTLRARQSISNQVRIPAQPQVMQQLAKLLKDPNVGIPEVGQWIGKDMVLSAKVLKVANSAFYGLRERCLSPQHAASVLGLKVLRSVVMQAAVVRQFEHLAGGSFDLKAHWQHSILTGQVASALSPHLGPIIGLDADELYTCGLMHDLGQVVLLEALGNGYQAIIAKAGDCDQARAQIEQQVFGFTHADVGAVVAEQWGLPEAAIRAILEHHGASEGGELAPLSRRIQAADSIAHTLRSPEGMSMDQLREVVGAPLLRPEQLLERLCQLAEQCEP